MVFGTCCVWRVVKSDLRPTSANLSCSYIAPFQAGQLERDLYPLAWEVMSSLAIPSPVLWVHVVSSHPLLNLEVDTKAVVSC